MRWPWSRAEQEILHTNMQLFDLFLLPFLLFVHDFCVVNRNHIRFRYTVISGLNSHVPPTIDYGVLVVV